jgi:hypothetical protein
MISPNRRGNLLIITFGILTGIVLFSTQYFRYMQQQKRLSYRVGEHRLLNRLGYAFAVLACHKLRVSPQIMFNQDSESAYPSVGSSPDSDGVEDFLRLFQNLSRPLADMTDQKGLLDLDDLRTGELSFLQESLAAGLLHQGHLDPPQISWSCHKDDFQPCGTGETGFPREKKGIIRLFVKLTLRKGDQRKITEDFRFAVRVKVTSLLTPVLSKFSLYVEQAGKSGEPLFLDYNQVSIDANGNLSTTRGAAHPMILNSWGDHPVTLPNQFQEFVNSPVGLIYLGGDSTIQLNLARSDRNQPDSNSGEGFMTFRSPEGWGWIPRRDKAKTDEEGEIIPIEMQMGVSDDPDPAASSWYSKGTGNSTLGRLAIDILRMKKSSIFRLYGTTAKVSPTLVMGNVVAGFLLSRGLAFPTGPGSENPPVKWLPSFDWQTPTFEGDEDETGGNEAPMTFNAFYESSEHMIERFITAFDLPYTEYGCNLFNSNFGSFVGSHSFNMALGYLKFPGQLFPEQRFPAGDLLSRFVTTGAPPAEGHQIPSPWQECAPGVTDLKRMKAFVGALERPDRPMYVLTPAPGETNLWKALEARGLISQGRLALNGWVVVKSPMRFELPPRPIEFLSNGGFLVEEGDIVLNNSLEPASHRCRKNCLLALVALNGNIDFRGPPTGQKVHASCIAFGEGDSGGKIRFLGPPATIIGNLAMKRTHATVEELQTFKGPKLDYHPLLAAQPNSPEEAQSEKPLLMYQFEEVPILLP